MSVVQATLKQGIVAEIGGRMPEIAISNEKGRDAVVSMESVATPVSVRWLDPAGRQASSVRIVKGTIDRDLPHLLRDGESPSDLSQRLIDEDPEVDMETIGQFLQNTSRVLVDQQGHLVHKVHRFEIVKNPDGSERERRPKSAVPPNISSEAPLRWSGKMIPKEEAIRKFVFSNKVQLHHINGLTYDFLFAMAKELEQKNALMLLGAGPKSNQPLILRRGSIPYRGFLEGRTEGDRYCLVLHLSNLELKSPEKQSPDNESSDPEAAE